MFLKSNAGNKRVFTKILPFLRILQPENLPIFFRKQIINSRYIFYWMGQYFIIVNLEKREYIHPHDIKRGAKLLEISKDPIIHGLMLLLQSKNKQKTTLHLGSWANDKILFIGDFEDSSFFKQVIVSFKNISKEAYNEYLIFPKMVYIHNLLFTRPTFGN